MAADANPYFQIPSILCKTHIGVFSFHQKTRLNIGKDSKPTAMDSADDTSDQVSNENIFAKDSDEAKVCMHSTENTSGQFQERISLSICSELETSSEMDNNLAGEVEEPKGDFTSGSFCNSENKLHTPTDETLALKHAIASPECFSSGRNKKRALPIDDNELEEEDAEEGKRPTAKKIRTDDQSECMAANNEIMEERNEFGQSIDEKSRHSAKDRDNEVKRDDAEGEEKTPTVNHRTGNESGCKAVEDEIMEEKDEFRQNIDEESLHLAEEHNNKVKEDAEEERNPTAKENETDNQSGFMVAEDEIMEERNGFMQNTGEELQHSAENYDNEVKRDDAEEQDKLTAMENRTANESGYMTAEDEIMEEEDESIESIGEESLHSAEDQENVMSISDYDENEDDLETFEAGLNDRLNEFGKLDPLADEEQSIVKLALSEKYRHVVLVKHPNISERITGGLLQYLKPNRWLSSDIINVYLVALKEREKNDPKSFLKCHFFNTFFYTSLDRDLKSESITSIMRKTRKLEYQLVNCDKIFVPINEKGRHWVVVVIDIQKKKIQYLDSLLGENRQAMEVIAWYIKEEAKDKSESKIDLDTKSWKMEFPKNIPRQRNNNDCGVFMLKYIDFLSRGLPMNFQQRHIPLFREKLVLEILNITGYASRMNLE